LNILVKVGELLKETRNDMRILSAAAPRGEDAERKPCWNEALRHYASEPLEIG
jgi:hypothetical protein